MPGDVVLQNNSTDGFNNHAAIYMGTDSNGVKQYIDCLDHYGSDSDVRLTNWTGLSQYRRYLGFIDTGITSNTSTTTAVSSIPTKSVTPSVSQSSEPSISPESSITSKSIINKKSDSSTSGTSKSIISYSPTLRELQDHIINSNKETEIIEPIIEIPDENIKNETKIIKPIEIKSENTTDSNNKSSNLGK